MADHRGIPKSVLVAYADSLSVAPESKRNYVASVRDFGDALRTMGVALPKASADEINVALDAMNDGLSPSTACYRANAVRRFLSWHSSERDVADMGRLVDMPDFKFSMTRKELTPEQADAVLRAALGDGETASDLLDNLLINLMLRAALRPLEIHNADVSDVIRERGQGIMRIRAHGKTPESYALLTKPVMRALGAYLSARVPEGASPLVTSVSTRSYGGRLSERSIRRKVQEVFERAGIPGTAGDYSLRHTAIYMTMRSGANAEEVQQLARLRGISSFRNWEERVFLESDMAAAQRLELAMEGHEISDRMCVIGAKELQAIAAAFCENDELALCIDRQGRLGVEVI